MNYVDVCPPAVVYEIQKADVRSADSSGLILWVASHAERPCTLAAIEAVARRLMPDSDLTVIDLFCNAVASYADLLDADQKAVIRAAYLRFPYRPTIASNYFLGLREARIDLRAELVGKIPVDWTFASPMNDAQTWDYYLYLVALEEPGALDALAAKIAETRNGNDATLLLMSLAELPGHDVDEILKTYADDPRTADGVNGPGLTIAANVQLMLEDRSAP